MTETYDLTKVHNANLSMLKEIDRICRTYKIKYLLDAGTLLGAVRHQGFVPWDDDADVVFTRKNYEAFKKVVKRELSDTMSFLEPQEFRNGKGFYDFTARIFYKNSRMHEDNEEMKFYEGKLNHLWVDLFVLDVLPKNPLAARFTKLMQTLIYGLAMGHRYQLDYSKYSPALKLAVGTLAGLGRLLPMKFLFWLQHKIAIKDSNKETGLYYYSNYQPDFLYVTLQRPWSDKVVELDFCDTKLMAPSGYHEVLTWIYGDYQKMPPKDKQIPAHSSIKIQIFD